MWLTERLVSHSANSIPRHPGAHRTLILGAPLPATGPVRAAGVTAPHAVTASLSNALEFVLAP